MTSNKFTVERVKSCYPSVDRQVTIKWLYLTCKKTCKKPAKKQLIVGMLLELLCSGPGEKLEARECFPPSASLLGNRLISPAGTR